MITREETRGLRAEEKDAILDTILGMAWTDGEIQPGELALLRRIACFFTDADVEPLLADYKTDLERLGRKIAASDLGPTGRRVLVKGMAYMAAASGNVTNAERSFYRQCLRAFGLSEAQRSRVEAQVREFVYEGFAEERFTAAKGGDLAPETRAELEEKRKSLELDAETAARIEREVRAGLEKVDKAAS
jgi:uncharacterized tellurite resistance protein B-like protein